MLRGKHNSMITSDLRHTNLGTPCRETPGYRSSIDDTENSHASHNAIGHSARNLNRGRRPVRYALTSWPPQEDRSHSCPIHEPSIGSCALTLLRSQQAHPWAAPKQLMESVSMRVFNSDCTTAVDVASLIPADAAFLGWICRLDL